MEKGKKVGLTTLNWVLCIVGILFFMTFIVLPPTFRAFIPEEENNNNNNNSNVNNASPTPDNTPSVTTITTICTKTGIENEEYRIIIENEKVKIIAYTNESDYLEGITSTSCGDQSVIPASEGLYTDCQINESRKILTYRLTLENYKESTSPLPFDYKLSSEEITSYLTSDGFSCNQENNE